VSTAAGPNSEAMMAAAPSVVLRHEQGFLFVLDGASCIGQAWTLPWGQMHSGFATTFGMAAHNALGVTVNAASCISNQP
jgi:hypothetical protein